MDARPVHVLLIEDEEAHAELIRRAFEAQAGAFRLTVVGSLAQARDRLAEFTPDLVIADLLLPDGRGMDLVPAVGEEAPFPVVVMTSHGDEQAAVEAMKAGAMDYVVKTQAVLSDTPRIAQRVLREWRHVAERRRAEEALRTSEKTAQTLLTSARAVLRHREFGDAARAIFDAAKDLTGATAGYVALLSTDGAENEVLFLDSGGRPCTVDPDLPMPIRGLRAEAYRTGKPVYDNQFASSGWVFFLPDGHARLDNVLFAPLVIDEKAVGLLGLANKPGGFTDDDAEAAAGFAELAAVALHNSRMLESLEHSEERFKSVVETAGDAIISIDIEGRIVSWNRASERLFGYSRDEALGEALARMMPDRFRQAHLEGLSRLASGAPSRIIGHAVELVGLRKDGSEFPLELTLAQWQTREGRFCTGVLRDITERTRAEVAIRDLAKFPSENPHPIMRIGRDGTVLYTNAAGAALLEQWGSAEGQPAPAPWRQLVEQVLRDGDQQTIAVEHERRIFSFAVVPVPEAAYVNWYGQDITDRVRSEEAVRVSRRFLAVANRHGEMMPLLKEFVAEVRSFTGCAAVDIRILDEDGNIPYQIQDGFSPEFYERESPLSIRAHHCMCIDVIQGAVDTGLPFVTEGGSFFLNGTTRFLASLSEEQRGRTRNVCNQFGYESVALIPIRRGRQILGLVHIADPEEDMIARRTVEALEAAANQLGTAIHRVQAEEELRQHRERLEELVEARTAALKQTNEQLRREIAERERAEQALAEQSRILEASFTHTITPLVFLDRDFTFIRVNEAYARACQRDVSDFPGRNHFEMYPSDAKAIFEDVVRTKEPYQATARPFSFPDHPEWGVTYWDWALVPILDDDGEVEFLAFSLEDVTERTLAESRLLSYQERLRSLTSELSLAEERARRRIARGLHDQIGQALAISKVKLQALRASSGHDVAGPLDEIRDLLSQAIRDTRTLTFDLSPPILYELGFEAAVEWLTEHIGQEHSIRTRCEDDGNAKPLDDALRVVLFQGVRELLLNVVKHARARHAHVSMCREGDRIRISVRDDGVGFDASSVLTHPGGTGGFGLFSIRERLDYLGGRLTMESAPGQGTQACLEAPLRVPEGE